MFSNFIHVSLFFTFLAMLHHLRPHCCVHARVSSHKRFFYFLAAAKASCILVKPFELPLRMKGAYKWSCFALIFTWLYMKVHFLILQGNISVPLVVRRWKNQYIYKDMCHGCVMVLHKKQKHSTQLKYLAFL